MHERKGRAPNLYIYRAKNKDRNHTINSCEMLQTSRQINEKAATLSPILTIKSAGLARARLGPPNVSQNSTRQRH